MRGTAVITSSIWPHITLVAHISNGHQSLTSHNSQATCSGSRSAVRAPARARAPTRPRSGPRARGPSRPRRLAGVSDTQRRCTTTVHVSSFQALSRRGEASRGAGLRARVRWRDRPVTLIISRPGFGSEPEKADFSGGHAYMYRVVTGCRVVLREVCQPPVHSLPRSANALVASSDA